MLNVLDNKLKIFSRDANCLTKHTVAVENLTDAIKKFEVFAKKSIGFESQQPPSILKEAITSFMESYINPRYYRETDFLQLAAFPSRISASPSDVTKVEVSNTLDRELEDIYRSALERAFKVNL